VPRGCTSVGWTARYDSQAKTPVIARSAGRRLRQRFGGQDGGHVGGQAARRSNLSEAEKRRAKVSVHVIDKILEDNPGRFYGL